MTNTGPFVITAVTAVFVYYLLAWVKDGRDPDKGVLVTSYEPPQGLSPAMLRYVWKQGFDDRTFWAAVLSLVSKGLATLADKGGVAIVHPTFAAKKKQVLPREERVLLDNLFYRRAGKGIATDMLDSNTAITATHMAGVLRQAAMGKWFRQNRDYIIGGIVLSLAAVCIAAWPQTLEQAGALGWALCMMAPGAFYIVFLLLRLADLYRAIHHKVEGVVIRRAIILLAWIVPCVAAQIAGIVVLWTTFGWRVVATAALMVAVNLIFLHLMKAPTIEGGLLLDKIEGFRDFLKSVEQLPMDRKDAPCRETGLYEKYLPYAMALEVEQAWSDRFVALASSSHKSETLDHSHSYYLGMWDDEPVEIVVGPQRSDGRL